MNKNLDGKQIQSQLKHAAIPLIVLEKTVSTNEYLKSLDKSDPIVACLAETQTAGRGRLQRQWHSPFAENIYLSLLYPMKKNAGDLTGLSLIIGLAICRAIESMLDLTLQLKWPNDILINGNKLAGTLIEIKTASNENCQAIIGIGVNVNMKTALKNEVDQAWTSLIKETGQYIDRNNLSATIIDNVIDYVERFLLNGLAAFIDEWHTRDCLKNSPIIILSANKKYEGIGNGINEQGHLIIKTKEGNELAFSSGDATLLK